MNRFFADQESMSVLSLTSLTLVLSLGWLQVYWATARHFNGVTEYKEVVRVLKQQSQEEKLKLQLVQESFTEYQQTVAQIMPVVLPIGGKGKNGFPLRTLAAVVSPSAADGVKSVVVKTLFERGQELFRNKKFDEASDVFKKFLNRYSYSAQAPDAYFLWLDASYQLGDYQKTTELANQMIELFPGYELTGFALLRLGRVYEGQGRADDAVEIYRTVMRSFPQADLVGEAKKCLKGLDI